MTPAPVLTTGPVLAAAFSLAAAVVVWVGARARLGARARAAAGVRLGVTERFVTLLGPKGGRALVVGALAGAVVGGAGAAIAGALLAAVSQPLLQARAAADNTRRLDAQLPETLRVIATSMRAGRNLPQALEIARDEARPPLRAALDAAVRLLEVGGTLDAALTALSTEAPTGAACHAVETLRLARVSGSNLPAVLDVAAESLLERERIARDRRAATSQARLSAAIVGGMPFAFFALMGSAAAAQLDVLVSGPLGWMLLACGLSLELAGVLWVRRLSRAPW